MRSLNISIWFFIGVLLTIYGTMILGYGLYELTLPQMAVANYHASVWWGGLLLAVGLFYDLRFWPTRTS